jgi:catalase
MGRFARLITLPVLLATPDLALAEPDAPVATGEQLVRDLHTAFGEHHARAVHAKGIILEGRFEPAAAAKSLSIAMLFKRGTVVTVRFSNFTGLPAIPDNDPNANPRGMAIKFGPVSSPALAIVAHNFDGFPTPTAAEFGALLRAIGTSGKGVATPTPLDKFLADHPVAKTFLTTQHPAPISYATTAYYGVNAVNFIDEAGRRQAVRYRFVPAAGEAYYGEGDVPGPTAEYLQTEIERRITEDPIRFVWLAQLAEPGDRLDDPSIAWPAKRRLVELGTITIDRLAPNTPADDRALLFLPGLMPEGIEAADPMLAIRSEAYPVSFEERQ